MERGLVTYHFVNIPAAMLPSLLRVGHALVNSEMPVHVCRLLAAAFVVRPEAAPALSTGRAKVFVELRNQMRAKAGLTMLVLFFL